MSVNVESTQLQKSGLVYLTNNAGMIKTIKLVASFN